MFGDRKAPSPSSSTSSPSPSFISNTRPVPDPDPLTVDDTDNPTSVPLETFDRARRAAAPVAVTPSDHLTSDDNTHHPRPAPLQTSLISSSADNDSTPEHGRDETTPHDTLFSHLENHNTTTMAPKPSLLTNAGRTPSYGAVSQTPSGNVSPTDSDTMSFDAHLLRTVSGTTRSETSRHTTLSRKPSRLIDDLDGSALATGPDGRFGVAQATVPASSMRDRKRTPAASDDEYGEDLGSDDDDDPLVDDSPYDAVRASVSPTDNTALSINTPRMWTLSVLFSIIGSSTNLFFSLRYPSVAITPVIALLLVHPLGLMWDYFLKFSTDPHEEFVHGTRSRRLDPHPERRTAFSRARLWLGQGRWNEKEHTCVYVSSNVSFGFAFATDVIVEQSKFYNQEATITYQLLLTLSTQILGYAFAGLTRRFLVRPAGMIWPGTLMSAAMFGTLHREDNKPANGWVISRWRFFYIIWTGAFVFYFLPGLLMPCLSYFNVLTWFAPKNVVVANLFGVSSGLGLFPVTFDWAQITYIGSPLLVPFWAAVNVIGGMFVVMWLIAPIAYYKNVFYSSYMPILSASVFDNKGKIYDVSKILTKDFLFDKAAYSKYSRVFLPITYALSYGVQFAGLAALLTHTACWHGKEMWQTWQRSWQEVRDEDKGAYRPLSGGSASAAGEPGDAEPGSPMSESSHLFREDVHSRLMKRYPDAPISWYMATFVSMLAIGMFVVE